MLGLLKKALYWPVIMATTNDTIINNNTSPPSAQPPGRSTSTPDDWRPIEDDDGWASQLVSSVERGKIIPSLHQSQAEAGHQPVKMGT